jgi:hypothetical protein
LQSKYLELKKDFDELQKASKIKETNYQVLTVENEKITNELNSFRSELNVSL